MNDVFISADQCEKSDNEPTKASAKNQDNVPILSKSLQGDELIVKGTAITLKVCYRCCGP